MRRPGRPSPALVVALLALGTAVGGTALAGSPSPTTTAKHSAKVYAQRYAKAYARKYAKRGATGAKGATGARGLAGAPGPPGVPGAAKGGGGSVRVGGTIPLGLTNATVAQLSGPGGQKLRLGPGTWEVYGTAIVSVHLGAMATVSEPSCNIVGESTPGFDFFGFPQSIGLSTANFFDELTVSARGEAVVSATRDFDVSLQCSQASDAVDVTGGELDVWAVPKG
jgi:hypothetical protein